MTDPPPQPEPHTSPRWVKLLGIIVLVVILVAVVIMVASGGRHGPGRHQGGGGTPAGRPLAAGGERPSAGFEHKP